MFFKNIHTNSFVFVVGDLTKDYLKDRNYRIASDAEFKESEHPRDEDGKFTSAGGSNTVSVTQTSKNFGVTQSYTPTEKSSIKEYQSGSYNSEVGGYSAIQSYLKTGEVNSQLWNEEKGKQIVKEIENAFNKSRTTEDQTVYRGMRLEKGKGQEFLSLKPGDVFAEKGITSTTSSTKIRSKFTQKLNRSDTPVEIEIKVPKNSKAIDVGNLTGDNHEKEVALGPNTKFKVISNKKRGEVVKIELEVLHD